MRDYHKNAEECSQTGQLFGILNAQFNWVLHSYRFLLLNIFSKHKMIGLCLRLIVGFWHEGCQDSEFRFWPV
jgi:hypothetical protein